MIRQLTGGGASFQDLQFLIATATAKLKGWPEKATDTVGELGGAHTGVVLQLEL